jgi:hypothetical protein
MKYKPINSFQDLEVWKVAHQNVLALYQLTANFPVVLHNWG